MEPDVARNRLIDVGASTCSFGEEVGAICSWKDDCCRQYSGEERHYECDMFEGESKERRRSEARRCVAHAQLGLLLLCSSHAANLGWRAERHIRSCVGCVTEIACQPNDARQVFIRCLIHWLGFRGCLCLLPYQATVISEQSCLLLQHTE